MVVGLYGFLCEFFMFVPFFESLFDFCCSEFQYCVRCRVFFVCVRCVFCSSYIEVVSREFCQLFVFRDFHDRVFEVLFCFVLVVWEVDEYEFRGWVLIVVFCRSWS